VKLGVVRAPRIEQADVEADKSESRKMQKLGRWKTRLVGDVHSFFYLGHRNENNGLLLWLMSKMATLECRTWKRGHLGSCHRTEPANANGLHAARPFQNAIQQPITVRQGNVENSN
jgi:hypothetical protein